MRNLRIGFDIDGVLADFVGSFLEVSNKLFGQNVQTSQWTSWDAKELFTDTQMDQVWEEIRTTRNFWQTLQPSEPEARLYHANANHTLFFITSRVPGAGLTVEEQTQEWLDRYKLIRYPTVLVVPHYSLKLPLMQALKLDSFIDDKVETVEMLRAVDINCYIYDQPYNQKVEAPRVKSILDYIKNVEDRFGRI
jgi:uncharacterized HAD superfamily protein